VDAFVHIHQVVEAMKKIRMVIIMQVVMWIHFSLRYAALRHDLV
jgi:hypothetical protein